MTRKDIEKIVVKNVPDNNNIPVYLISYIVQTTFDVLANELEKGNSVFIKGLGTFRIVKRQGRLSYDYRSKKTIIIPSHKAIVFKPAQKLKEALKRASMKGEDI